MQDLVARYVLPAVFSLLPPAMNTPAAHAFLVTIALQESRCVHRRQVGGPARGLWQFKHVGIVGVLHHDARVRHASAVLAALGHQTLALAADVLAAIEHNDILAAAIARLLLWTLPEALPAREAPDAACGNASERGDPGSRIGPPGTPSTRAPGSDEIGRTPAPPRHPDSPSCDAAGTLERIGDLWVCSCCAKTVQATYPRERKTDVGGNVIDGP